MISLLASRELLNRRLALTFFPHESRPATFEPRAFMLAGRILVVVADDLGIGPETTEGILELASLGVVTGTVLLAHSPHAVHAVERWKAVGRPCDLGWHPCLTLDAPVCRASEVSSLVDEHGRMGPLGRFLGRLLTGRVRADHIQRELRAQYRRFRDLTGQLPTLVNAHHHVALFPPVGTILRDILREQSPLPWKRRVHETWATQRSLSGARFKRLVLSGLGQLHARRQRHDGFPGADALAGVGSPTAVFSDDFFETWLRHARGRVVELMCHPGRHDTTLLGRDARPGDGSLGQRVRELKQLRQPAFREAIERAGFRLARPSELLSSPSEGQCDAA